MLKHRDIKGTVEFDQETKMFFGELVGINGLVMYEADNGDDFEKNFISAVDEYIKMCEDNEMSIKKEFKGVFNVRTSPEMHEKLFMASVESKTKLNAIINDAFDVYFSTEKKKESTFDMATPPDRWSVIGNNKHAWLKSDSSKIPTEKVYVVFDARDDNSYTVLSTCDLDIHKRNEFDIPSWKSIMDKMRKDRLEKKK